MIQWTPSLVEERLAEAAFVLKRLPEPRRQGYFSTWPEVVHSFGDNVGQEPRPMRILPSPQAISRMEETLTWTACLEPMDGKIIWMKAHGDRWKTICWTVGLGWVSTWRMGQLRAGGRPGVRDSSGPAPRSGADGGRTPGPRMGSQSPC